MHGCAKPIPTEYYSRTPPSAAPRELPGGKALRVGVSVDVTWALESVRATKAKRDVGVIPDVLYAPARELAEAFITHARDRSAFAEVDWVRPQRVEALDYQVELLVSFEYGGGKSPKYCLGRLVANLYSADHSKLLDRAVFFHEAMYTSKDSKQPQRTLAGEDVLVALRAALFDQLIARMTKAVPAAEPETSNTPAP